MVTYRECQDKKYSPIHKPKVNTFRSSHIKSCGNILSIEKLLTVGVEDLGS